MSFIRFGAPFVWEPVPSCPELHSFLHRSPLLGPFVRHPVWTEGSDGPTLAGLSVSRALAGEDTLKAVAVIDMVTLQDLSEERDVLSANLIRLDLLC